MRMEEALEAEGMKSNNAEEALIVLAALNAIVSLRFAWKDNPHLCDSPYTYHVHAPCGPSMPHVNVKNWTLAGRITVSEHFNHTPTSTHSLCNARTVYCYLE